MIDIPPYAALVLADNPGPMTLDGTNSWVLRGEAGVVVVDPGPQLPQHLERLTSYGPVLLVLLTHGHADHAAAAEAFASPVAALDPALCRRSEQLHDGDVLEVPGLPALTVVATPGHTSDSVCFRIDDALLSGDTLLGLGSTMVSHPDGGLGDYLASLRRLSALCAADTVLLPGHGPAGGSALALLDRQLSHRLDRLDQVRRALAAGATSPADVVAIVYPGIGAGLAEAAEQTVRAQLDYLAEQARSRH